MSVLENIICRAIAQFITMTPTQMWHCNSCLSSKRNHGLLIYNTMHFEYYTVTNSNVTQTCHTRYFDHRNLSEFSVNFRKKSCNSPFNITNDMKTLIALYRTKWNNILDKTGLFNPVGVCLWLWATLDLRRSFLAIPHHVDNLQTSALWGVHPSRSQCDDASGIFLSVSWEEEKKHSFQSYCPLHPDPLKCLWSH
jgi:hypothetical protein